MARGVTRALELKMIIIKKKLAPFFPDTVVKCWFIPVIESGRILVGSSESDEVRHDY